MLFPGYDVAPLKGDFQLIALLPESAVFLDFHARHAIRPPLDPVRLAEKLELRLRCHPVDQGYLLRGGNPNVIGTRA
jgi:hypothetical protein